MQNKNKLSQARILEEIQTRNLDSEITKPILSYAMNGKCNLLSGDLAAVCETTGQLPEEVCPDVANYAGPQSLYRQMIKRIREKMATADERMGVSMHFYLSNARRVKLNRIIEARKQDARAEGRPVCDVNMTNYFAQCIDRDYDLLPANAIPHIKERAVAIDCGGEAPPVYVRGVELQRGF